MVLRIRVLCVQNLCNVLLLNWLWQLFENQNRFFGHGFITVCNRELSLFRVHNSVDKSGAVRHFFSFEKVPPSPVSALPSGGPATGRGTVPVGPCRDASHDAGTKVDNQQFTGCPTVVQREKPLNNR